jgi:hypothetical protein
MGDVAEVCGCADGATDVGGDVLGTKHSARARFGLAHRGGARYARRAVTGQSRAGPHEWTLKEGTMRLAAPLGSAVMLAALVLAGALGRCTTPAAGPGTGGTVGVLEGHVTIGPICPVERPDQPCPVPPEAYAARKIIVYTADRGRRGATVSIDGTGHYRVELEPGRYVVDFNHAGIDTSKSLPTVVEIQPARTVTLDVDIDTGIR